MEENKKKMSRVSLWKRVLVDCINNKMENIKSINSVYQNIDKEKRYEIVVIVIEEEHYEDV